jgi:tellurite resistance protein
MTARLPVGLFGSVLGVAGLGLALRLMDRTLHAGILDTASELLLVLAAVLFAILAVFYGLKCVRHRSVVAHEFTTPATQGFFAAVPMSLLLLSLGVAPYARALAEVAWWAGSLLQFAIATMLVARWLGERDTARNAAPSWFLPIAGGQLVPIAGVPLGYVSLPWLFFVFGAIGLPVVLTLVLLRLWRGPRLADAAMPGTAILIAPAPLTLLAWLSLDGSGADAVSGSLFALSLVLAVPAIVALPRLVRLPFSAGWWSYTFPLDALTSAALTMAQTGPDISGGSGIALLGNGLFVLAAAVVALVLARSAAALAQGRLLPPLAAPNSPIGDKSGLR